MTHYLNLPIVRKDLINVKTGDILYITGIIYTMRDQAHKRIIDLLDQGKDLPFNLKGSVVYYAGPSPKRDENIVGSIGPTTSYRMDSFTPRLLDEGMLITIGKGKRSLNVQKYLVNKGIYCAALGGTGALIAKSIKEFKIIAFEDLGPEGIYSLKVEKFSCIVIDDMLGNNFYN